MTIKNFAIVDLDDDEVNHMFLRMTVDTDDLKIEIHQRATADVDDLTLTIDVVMRSEQIFTVPDLITYPAGHLGEKSNHELEPDQAGSRTYETIESDDQHQNLRLWAVLGSCVLGGLLVAFAIGSRSTPSTHYTPNARSTEAAFGASPASGDPTRGIGNALADPSTGDARRGISADANSLRSGSMSQQSQVLPNKHIHQRMIVAGS
jgi:hypothetical protein